MKKIPSVRSFDSTLAFLDEPFRFIKRTSKDLRSDLFQMRLGGTKVICFTGVELSRLFHDEKYFIRKGASPEFVRATLLSKGGVQELDGPNHRHRKALILSHMTERNVSRLNEIFHQKLSEHSREWETLQRPIALYPEMKKIILEAVCEWAGVPLNYSEIELRVRDLAIQYEEAAHLSKNISIRVARKRSEKWIMEMVKGVRAGTFPVKDRSLLDNYCFHQDLDKKLLPPRIVAVEVLSILRPTMAVSLFIIKALHALRMYPEMKDYLNNGGEKELDHFVQEVRRFYPFFPYQMARVKEDFQWQGYEFKKGQRVIMDFYGTCHDERQWENPEKFDPERFEHRAENRFDFIPQGGGYADINHRCAGIPITITLMKQAIHFFLNQISYHVTPQDLSIDFHHPPGLINSGFLIQDVRFHTESAPYLEKSFLRNIVQDQGDAYI